MSQDKEKEVSFIFQYEVFSQLTFEDFKKKILFQLLTSLRNNYEVKKLDILFLKIY